MAKNVGNGTVITFVTTGFSAAVMEVNGQDQSRAEIETTDLSTTSWKTFMPAALADPGGIDFQIAFDPDEQPPILNAAETVRVQFPLPTAGGSVKAKVECTGFVTKWKWGVVLEGLMTADITVKFSGTPTWTDHS